MRSFLPEEYLVSQLKPRSGYIALEGVPKIVKGPLNHGVASGLIMFFSRKKSENRCLTLLLVFILLFPAILR